MAEAGGEALRHPQVPAGLGLPGPALEAGGESLELQLCSGALEFRDAVDVALGEGGITGNSLGGRHCCVKS